MTDDQAEAYARGVLTEQAQQIEHATTAIQGELQKLSISIPEARRLAKAI